MSLTFKEWVEKCPLCGSAWIGASETHALRSLLGHVQMTHACGGKCQPVLPEAPGIGSRVHVTFPDVFAYPKGEWQHIRCLPGIVTDLYGERYGPKGPFTRPAEDQRIIAVVFSGDPAGTFTKAGILRDDGHEPLGGDPGRLCQGRTFRPDTWHWGPA